MRGPARPFLLPLLSARPCCHSIVLCARARQSASLPHVHTCTHTHRRTQLHLLAHTYTHQHDACATCILHCAHPRAATRWCPLNMLLGRMLTCSWVATTDSSPFSVRFKPPSTPTMSPTSMIDFSWSKLPSAASSSRAFSTYSCKQRGPATGQVQCAAS